jgi:hypothetical protein
VDIHVYHHFEASHAIDAKLDAILGKLKDIEGRQIVMAGEIDALVVKVAGLKDVVAGAIVLLQGLKAALDAAIKSGDMAKVVEVTNDIGAQTQALADAIVANTPAA